tara:strand:+ start:495 stop:698 length:204 start_codon:yes stop_codon:yes gene_type:complete
LLDVLLGHLQLPLYIALFGDDLSLGDQNGLQIEDGLSELSDLDVLGRDSAGGLNSIGFEFIFELLNS